MALVLLVFFFFRACRRTVVLTVRQQQLAAFSFSPPRLPCFFAQAYLLKTVTLVSRRGWMVCCVERRRGARVSLYTHQQLCAREFELQLEIILLQPDVYCCCCRTTTSLHPAVARLYILACRGKRKLCHFY